MGDIDVGDIGVVDIGVNNIVGDVCVICLTDIKYCGLLIELNCKHLFCKECLNSWIKSKFTPCLFSNVQEVNICPICRDSSVDLMCIRCYKLCGQNNNCNCDIGENTSSYFIDKLLHSILLMVIIFILFGIIYHYSYNL